MRPSAECSTPAHLRARSQWCWALSVFRSRSSQLAGYSYFGPRSADGGSPDLESQARTTLFRKLRELVAVSLGEGRSFFENVRVRRHCLQGNAALCRLFEEMLHPCGGEDEQYPGRLGAGVLGLVDDAARYHDERARGSRDPALPHPHGQLPFEDVEGLLVVAVDVRQGPGRPGRDNVVVDRIRTIRVAVTDLDRHPTADRIGDGFAFVRANEQAFGLCLHVCVPSCCVAALYVCVSPPSWSAVCRELRAPSVAPSLKTTSPPSSPETSNPHFWSTRIEATLCLAT